MPTDAQKNAIAGLYIGYFDRAPDPVGLQFWYNQIDAGVELSTIAAKFAASSEAKALYPFLTVPDVASASEFVKSVFINLFGRAPDADGLKFWTGVIAEGTVPLGDMIQLIINGAVDAPAATPSKFDAAVLANKIKVALDFASDAASKPGFVFDGAAQSAAKAVLDEVDHTDLSVTKARAVTDAFLSAPNTTLVSIVLTTAVGENVIGTSGNDSFSGTIDALGLSGTPPTTLNIGDFINGAGGFDTANFVATSDSAFLPTNTTQDVEIVNLISDTPGDGFTGPSTMPLSVTNFVGVQQLWQVNSVDPLTVTDVNDDIIVGFRNTEAPGALFVRMASGATTANVAIDRILSDVIVISETAPGTLKTVNVNGSFATVGLVIDLDSTDAGVPASAEETLNLGITSDGPILALSETLKTIDASVSTGDLVLFGPASVETLIGGSGDDFLLGTSSSKIIMGGAGSDDIFSGDVEGEVINGGSNGNGEFKNDYISLGVSLTTSQTVITNIGETGLTFETADEIEFFDSGVDKLDFNLTAGSAQNFVDGGASSGFIDALSNANTIMDGTVQYFFSHDTGTGDVYLFVDHNLDGDADLAITMFGCGPGSLVFGDIIA